MLMYASNKHPAWLAFSYNCNLRGSQLEKNENHLHLISAKYLSATEFEGNNDFVHLLGMKSQI